MLVALESDKGEMDEAVTEERAKSKNSVSIFLRCAVAAGLQRTDSTEPGEPDSECCVGARRVGGWFGVKRRLRHSGEGRVQRERCARAGDDV